jgi:arylsulfatase A-like enzyme
MKTINGFARGFDSYQELLQTTPPFPQGGKALFDKALETLREGSFPRLFLFLHTYQLHSPYNPPEEFLRRLNPNPRSTDLQAVNAGQPAKTFLPVGDELRKSLKELYQAEVLAFDSYFGDFIARLRQMKLYDSSLIVFMSDHGEEFFDHRGWAHSQSLYNELIQVPLLIKFPGGQHRGMRLSQPVGVVDIMPTILSHLGIAYDAGRLDGVNLLPLIRGQKDGRRDPVVASMSSGKYFAHFPTRIALVSGRYKLIYNEPFTQQALEVFGQFAPPWQPAMFELYDVQADPGETDDIAVRRPEIKARMLPRLLRILQEIRRTAAGNVPQRMDEEMEKQLKALGYL